MTILQLEICAYPLLVGKFIVSILYYDKMMPQFSNDLFLVCSLIPGNFRGYLGS